MLTSKHATLCNIKSIENSTNIFPLESFASLPFDVLEAGIA